MARGDSQEVAEPRLSAAAERKLPPYMPVETAQGVVKYIEEDGAEWTRLDASSVEEKRRSRRWLWSSGPNGIWSREN